MSVGEGGRERGVWREGGSEVGCGGREKGVWKEGASVEGGWR